MPATSTNTLNISFIGFGELGQRFARDLAARPDVALSAYDIVFDDPAKRDACRAAAASRNVTPSPSLPAVCLGAAIVISAVTADQVEAVAATAAQHLTPGQIFLDVNSASPATKRRAAKLVEASGAEVLNAIGMNLSPVAVEHGKASAIKLCRSIMIKGLEALIVDSARASKHWGVEREVYASLTGTFPSIDWPRLADDMAERVATHGRRRAAEMREAADMLAEIDIDPGLARAVSDAHKRGAKQ
jgi:3-hydroxyisobutyrate dehydrogenase-like beta-hydroxyacid dehydrogenase